MKDAQSEPEAHGPKAPASAQADMPPTAPRVVLERFLRAVRLRLALRRALERAARIAPFVALPLILLYALARVFSLTLLANFAWQQAFGLAAAAAAVLVAGLALLAVVRPRFSDLDIALLVDRAVEGRETATTAVALAAEDDDQRWAEQALVHLKSRRPSDAAPWRALPWRLSAIACAGLLASMMVPPLAPALAPPPPAPVPAIAVTAKALSEGVKEIEERLEQREAPREAKQLMEQLRKQAEQMKAQPMTREQAQLQLQRLDQAVEQAQREREAGESKALSRALSSLEQSQLSREAARAASDGDLARLEKELKELAKGFADGKTYEDRELKRLAVRLREAAEELESTTHEELANQLKQLAEALEKGDMLAASKALEELSASEELREMTGQASTDRALEDARRLVQQALAQLGGAKSDSQLAGLLPGGPSGPGGEGGDPRAGQGGKDRAGRPIVPVDWGVGTTNEAAAETPMGRGHQSDRQSTETSDWREAYEALNDATRLEGAKGRASRLAGQVGEGQFIAVPTRTTATGEETAAAPIVRLPPSYAEAQEDALAQDRVPAGYDASVRKYFTSLAGEAEPEPKKP